MEPDQRGLVASISPHFDRSVEAEGQGGSACPLCGSRRHSGSYRCRGRLYFDCAECGLIHLSPDQRLDPAAERAHYETHENDPTDPRYRAFLSRLVAPLVERLAPGSTGLDYGSGPGPTLSLMLAELGFPTAIYDPFFSPDPEPLHRTYDFITVSETAEHFFEPARELARLDEMLRSGGWLGVLTDLFPPGSSFEEWHYWRDPTHVSFFRRSTMEWIAATFGWSLEEAAHTNVSLFRKP